MIFIYCSNWKDSVPLPCFSLFCTLDTAGANCGDIRDIGETPGDKIAGII